jgi:site-specific recombinase XerD
MDREKLLLPPDQLKTDLLLSYVADEFLVASKAAGITRSTQDNYKWRLDRFVRWATTNEVETIAQLTGTVIRSFLAFRADQGNKPGTLHSYFRTIRTLCLWMVREGLLSQNPVANVKAPKLSKDLLEPLTLEQIQALDKHLCNTKDPYVVRNRALVFMLLDTGIRVDECAAANSVLQGLDQQGSGI